MEGLGGEEAGLPDLAPVVSRELGHGFGGSGDGGVGGGLQALEVLVVAGEGAFDVGDGIGTFVGVGGGGGEGVEGRQEAIVRPTVGSKGDKGAKEGVEGKEMGDTGKVLGKGGNEMEKAEIKGRKAERGRGRGSAADKGGGAEHEGLEEGELLVGAFGLGAAFFPGLAD